MEHDSNSQWAIPTFLVHFLHGARDGGTLLYGLYRDVLLDRVWFLASLS